MSMDGESWNQTSMLTESAYGRRITRVFFPINCSMGMIWDIFQQLGEEYGWERVNAGISIDKGHYWIGVRSEVEG